MITYEKNVNSQESRGASLGVRLDAMVTALWEAQHVADSGDLDARTQVEFRHALEQTPDTASAWFEANAKPGGVYAVLPILAAQRVQRTTELAEELSLDLENMDVTGDTEGLQDLYRAIGQLHRQLEAL
jgi:hypothetical protein